MPSEISEPPSVSDERFDAIMKRLDALEEDNLQLKLRCEDLEDENEELRSIIKMFGRKLGADIKKVVEILKLQGIIGGPKGGNEQTSQEGTASQPVDLSSSEERPTAGHTQIRIQTPPQAKQRAAPVNTNPQVQSVKRSFADATAHLAKQVAAATGTRTVLQMPPTLDNPTPAVPGTAGDSAMVQQRFAQDTARLAAHVQAQVRHPSVKYSAPNSVAATTSNAGASTHAEHSAHVENSQLQEQQERLRSLCAEKKWSELLNYLKENPDTAAIVFPLRNNQITTTLHQVISGKGEQKVRVQIAELVLDKHPESASLTNIMKSLPLHSLCQKTAIDLNVANWSRILTRLVEVYPKGLATRGGHRQRTPLHILLTENCSLETVRTIISHSPQCLKMRDKDGYLPIHIYCRGDCYIGKLQALCEGYPNSVFEQNNEGDTPLSVLMKTCQKKGKPNYTCIDYLENQMILQQHRASASVAPSHGLPNTDPNNLDSEQTAAPDAESSLMPPQDVLLDSSSEAAGSEPPTKKARDTTYDI